VPESGDAVQAMKAGLMEIGDLFVVNKADREGAERSAFAIRSALELRTRRADWDPPVLLASATQGRGVAEVVDGFESHLGFLRERGGLERRRRQRLEQRLHDLLRDQLWHEFHARLPESEWREAIGALARRERTPHQVAERLIAAAGAGRGDGTP
jgi:LAO/AO transport system kinase